MPDPLDGRARLVVFTDAARELIPAARAEERRIEQEWEDHLGSRGYAIVCDALEQLRELTDESEPR